METVSAVIVSLDGGEMLKACLDALRGQGLLETIVVDNGSSADEVAWLSGRADVRLVRLGSNEGFAGPANRGVREAAREGRPGPDALLVLNNDCVLEPGYVASCRDALRADPGLAAVQGVVLDGAGERVDGCGIAWSARAQAVQIGWGKTPPAANAAPFPVPGISATAALYRRDVFLSLDGFEESFFAYYEDVDLSLRLARAGWRFACVPGARARHRGSATGRRMPRARWERIFQNRLRTLRRNLTPAAQARAHLSSLAAGLGLGLPSREIGPLAALVALAGAPARAAATRPMDRQVRDALPLLSALPR